MKDFSVAMALCDYIPVAFFAAAAILLQRDFYNKMSKGAFALFAAGTVNVFCAGALKATYKLLYALGICDFEVLSDMFFPLQAIGFLLAGIGMMAMLLHPQTKSKAYCLAAVAPQAFRGTFLFVGLMILGLAGMNIGLCVTAARMKKSAVVALFVVSFLLSLTMGYLSSRDFTQASMNWIAECINIVGQGLLFVGALLLHKAGLKEFAPIEQA